MNIKAILIDKYDYLPKEAEIMENELITLDAQVAPIFEAWKTTGEENNAEEFQGYSIDSLRSGYGMNFFAALVTLDWIVKDPEAALPALKQGIM
jgi:hypothetical protein